MRAAPLLLALVAALAAAQDEHPFVMPGTPSKVVPAPTPWFTGAQLLRQLDPPQGARDRAAEIREGMTYLMGVFDATESGLWCYTDGRKQSTPKQAPEAVRASAIKYLRQQPARRLQERAAVLIVDMWQQQWPCPPDGCCPGRGY